MPKWVVDMLGQMSPEGSITSMIGTMATLVVTVILRVQAARRKLDREMQSVPPSAAPAPDVDESALAAQLEQAQADLRRAEWRIKDLEHDLSRTGEDGARMASALRSMTAECSRLKARVAELEEKQRAIDSGHDHLGPPHPRTAGSRPSWEPVEVVEDYSEEERPTPPNGNRRPA